MKKNEFNTIFKISLVICVIIAIWAVGFNASFTVAAGAMFSFFTSKFGWLYLVSMFAFVIFAIFVAFSKWGNITLGKDGEKPEYKTLTWFAMLFGCGMGVGLVFWGVAEPISFYVTPAAGIEPQSSAAAQIPQKLIHCLKSSVFTTCVMHVPMHFQAESSADLR